MIINAGITQVYYKEGYDDALADQMLAEANIQMVRFRP
jgi:dCMP deaminase